MSFSNDIKNELLRLELSDDSERVSRHFPQTLRLDADVPQWKTERVRVA